MNDDPAPAVQPARGGRFWLMTAVAVGMLAATVSLGRWQLSRAAQKEALQAEIEAQKTLPPLDQQEFLALDPATSAMHRPVRLHGLWLTPHTVYLDNRQMHGLPGFYVLTPFAIEGSNQTVLVQRGWVQRNFTDRAQLAPIETPRGLVELVARIAPPPAHLLELAKESPPSAAAPGSSPIRQNLDLEAFRAQTGLPLRTDVSLLQTGPASEGLQRDWPVPALGIEKHYGYAFQWFGLAALVVILYVWFQFIAPYRRARRVRRG
ncbi:SURF1 family protein [Variovorax soli]|uniref:SURF1-like protein n=1 Tax=Variovorax soli TaxID=376815 RepID=A0ABU1NIZ0_9BURK|nr:SURF1 family protein [Variovorax soli]MDR6538422.1 cytochrome oxidase assembly protein ShyY1 [Variovorax soli]